MLCSTPVFSSNAGCAKKIINNFGFLITKNDAETIFYGLKKSILLLKKNTKKWNILKFKARTQIKKNFSIQKMADKYLTTWT